jgi:hypothetical protein
MTGFVFPAPILILCEPQGTSTERAAIFLPSIQIFPGVAGRSKTTVPVVGAGAGAIAAGVSLAEGWGGATGAAAEAAADADAAGFAALAEPRGRSALATPAATRMKAHSPSATATTRASLFCRAGSAGASEGRSDAGGLLGGGGPPEGRRGMTCSSSEASGEPGLMQLPVEGPWDHVPVPCRGQITAGD